MFQLQPVYSVASPVKITSVPTDTPPEIVFARQITTQQDVIQDHQLLETAGSSISKVGGEDTSDKTHDGSVKHRNIITNAILQQLSSNTAIAPKKIKGDPGIPYVKRKLSRRGHWIEELRAPKNEERQGVWQRSQWGAQQTTEENFHSRESGTLAPNKGILVDYRTSPRMVPKEEIKKKHIGQITDEHIGKNADKHVARFSGEADIDEHPLPMKENSKDINDVSTGSSHGYEITFHKTKTDKCTEEYCGNNNFVHGSAKAMQSANANNNLPSNKEMEPSPHHMQSNFGSMNEKKKETDINQQHNDLPTSDKPVRDSENVRKEIDYPLRNLLARGTKGKKTILMRSSRDIKSSINVLSSSTPSPTTPTRYDPFNLYQGIIPKDLTPKAKAFYSKYDPHEGVTTAVVLGGFFVFVCLLVVYKTKLKPMWKERHSRGHEATPAIPSEVNGSFSHLNKEFECIPLQTIHKECCDFEEDDDMFYLDELGNYVFPMVYPQAGSCSCPHSTVSPGTRRPSQASALSTAYTVKSLPGAMLYIPVESDYNTPVSLKRSLSDPEIYFPSAVRHSLIVAVNGMMPHDKMANSSSAQGNWIHSEKQDNSIRIIQDSGPLQTNWSDHQFQPNPAIPIITSLQDPSSETISALKINVINPTPNISPSHSLHSISRESKDDSESGPHKSDNFAGIPFLIVPPSPIRVRRVSFSDNSLEQEDDASDDTVTLSETKQLLTQPDISITMTGPIEDGETEAVSAPKSRRRSRCVSRQASLQASGSDSPTTRRRRTMTTRQMTLPCNFSNSMSYLQVPGQENRASRISPSIERRMRLPSGGIDVDERSETTNSPCANRQRLGPQSSIDSYYSFASEGDGDIFASIENLGRRDKIHRQSSFCIPDSNISEYSEFNEDFHSSISELFCQRGRGRLENQGTFSEQGSIRSLSIDQEEITFELPGMRAEETGGDNDDMLRENGRSPVGNFLSIPTIPEFVGVSASSPDFLQFMPFDDCEGYMSSSCSISMSSDIESSHQITVPVFIEPAPPEIRFGIVEEIQGVSEGLYLDYWQGEDHHRSGLVHQETMHTDSGMDTEDICPATPTGGRFSADALESNFSKKLGVSAEPDENLRMVLVRDIGIQCCAESPNLNIHRRKSQSGENLPASQSPPERPNSLGGTFPSELLF